MDILQRVRIRITDPNVSDELLNEYIQTIMDRLCGWEPKRFQPLSILSAWTR